MSYDPAVMRELLMSAFNGDELRELCFDYFPAVYAQFTDGQTQSGRVQLLLDHVWRQELFEVLLRVTERKNPRKYSEFAGRLVNRSGDRWSGSSGGLFVGRETVYVQQGKSEPTASDLVTKTRMALAAGNSALASKLASQLTELYPEESEGHYLHALTILRNRRPKLLALDETRAIERLLLSAIALKRQAHHFYFLALLRSDFYGTNGLRVPSPDPAELVYQAETTQIDSREVRFMLAYVPVPDSPLVRYIERRCG